MKRSGFLRRSGPLKRSKPLGAGRKTRARRASIKDVLDSYFARFPEGEARCQLSERIITRKTAVAHHKTPRSELRKAGVQDLDAAHRLLILHEDVHIALHDWQMGRPKREGPRLRFELVEQAEANAENGKAVILRTI